MSVLDSYAPYTVSVLDIEAPYTVAVPDKEAPYAMPVAGLRVRYRHSRTLLSEYGYHHTPNQYSYIYADTRSTRVAEFT
eukprot:3280475-Rhodomonas_salina.6